VPGERSAENVAAVVQDFRRRTGGRVMNLITTDGYSAYDYRYAYCSPCHKGYRSPSPAPMLSQRTDFLVFSADNTNNYHKLVACSLFVLNRVAA
jgi:hypothetical protein